MRSIEELYKVFKDRCNLLKIIYKDKELIDEDTKIYGLFNMYSNFEDIMSEEEYKKQRTLILLDIKKEKDAPVILIEF